MATTNEIIKKIREGVGIVYYEAELVKALEKLSAEDRRWMHRLAMDYAQKIEDSKTIGKIYPWVEGKKG